MRALIIFAAVCGLWLVGASTAEAQIYKFKKSDGTVVYTDSLAQLPPERRAHYNRLMEEQAKKRADLERTVGKDELLRREAEEQRAALLKQQMDEEERARRLKDLDAQLEGIRKKDRERDAVKAHWQDRLKKAVTQMNTLLERFQKVQEKYQSLATRADFTLFPGQAKQRDDAKKEMDALEVEIDALAEEINFVIPEEARKAGIPPGWLR